MPLGDFRSVHLPYCLKRQGNGAYVVLNREYKPIGFKTSERLRYSDYPIETKFKRLTAATARKISYNNDPDLENIYLYNDGCVPTNSAKNMQEYLERLSCIAKLKIE